MKKKNLCQKQSCLSAKNNFLCEHHRKKWFLKPAHKQINTYRPITDPQLDRQHLTFRDFPCKKTSVWNKPINSILMTCPHPNLDSASGWLQPVPGSQNEIVGKIEWGRSKRERFLLFYFYVALSQSPLTRLSWSLEQVRLVEENFPYHCHNRSKALARPVQLQPFLRCHFAQKTSGGVTKCWLFSQALKQKKMVIILENKCETLNIF